MTATFETRPAGDYTRHLTQAVTAFIIGLVLVTVGIITITFAEHGPVAGAGFLAVVAGMLSFMFMVIRWPVR